MYDLEVINHYLCIGFVFIVILLFSSKIAVQVIYRVPYSPFGFWYTIPAHIRNVYNDLIEGALRLQNSLTRYLLAAALFAIITFALTFFFEV
jgi:hypothetical protein